MLNQFSDWLKVLLQVANIVIIGYGLYRFLNKPHDTLSDEVKQLKAKTIELELELKELKQSVDTSFEKHREQDKTNAVFKSVMLSFVNYEIAFCLHTDYKDTTDLLNAKKELQDYLSGKEKG